MWILAGCHQLFIQCRYNRKMQIPFISIWMTHYKATSAQSGMRTRFFRWGGLGAILLLAAVLRFANLDALGLANHYYAAAVKSMLQSWHNFFFVAAEPGGSVSVDKPPLGLWIQAISAGIFGINSFGLLFPEILAGLCSVAVVYSLVERWFGTAAGLLAALALAITPVVVATDRNNTIDSLLIFTLLLAAWAFIKATETSRLRYLLLGAVLIGLGFNIKMLEAYLPLPAFVAFYFLGAKEGIWRKAGKLLLASLVILALSLSWMLAVDLTPASQRPYVGSSSDNSEISLAIGYNGLNRLLGMFGGRGALAGGTPNVFPTGNGNNNPGFGGSTRGGQPPGGFNNGGGFAARGAPGGGGGTGMFDTGQVGALRLFIPPLSKEASWLLPFGLFSLLLLILGARLAWPFAQKHQAAVLWGGWLLTAGIFFSVAGFFHEYYLSTLAPPLAALVGIGLAETWQLGRKHHWLAALMATGAAALTLVLQYNTATNYVKSPGWLLWVAVLFILGTGLLWVVLLAPQSIKNRLAAVGYTGLMAALLVTPGVWSGLTNLHSSDNQSLPAAYTGRSNGPSNFGRAQVDQALLSFLQVNTKDTYYLMAVPSSMQGADYVIATGRPVLYMGGFNGQDQVLSVDSLAALVNSGKLRYIYAGSEGGGRGFGGGMATGQADISLWVTSHCTMVNGYNTDTKNTGAPDGITGGTGTDGFSGNLAVSLYDCRPGG